MKIEATNLEGHYHDNDSDTKKLRVIEEDLHPVHILVKPEKVIHTRYKAKNNKP